jgi:hypothetical protein
VPLRVTLGGEQSNRSPLVTVFSRRYFGALKRRLSALRLNPSTRRQMELRHGTFAASALCLNLNPEPAALRLRHLLLLLSRQSGSPAPGHHLLATTTTAHTARAKRQMVNTAN